MKRLMGMMVAAGLLAGFSARAEDVASFDTVRATQIDLGGVKTNAWPAGGGTLSQVLAAGNDGGGLGISNPGYVDTTAGDTAQDSNVTIRVSVSDERTASVVIGARNVNTMGTDYPGALQWLDEDGTTPLAWMYPHGAAADQMSTLRLHANGLCSPMFLEFDPNFGGIYWKNGDSPGMTLASISAYLHLIRSSVGTVPGEYNALPWGFVGGDSSYPLASQALRLYAGSGVTSWGLFWNDQEPRYGDADGGNDTGSVVYDAGEGALKLSGGAGGVRVAATADEGEEVVNYQTMTNFMGAVVGGGRFQMAWDGGTCSVYAVSMDGVYTNKIGDFYGQ